MKQMYVSANNSHDVITVEVPYIPEHFVSSYALDQCEGAITRHVLGVPFRCSVSTLERSTTFAWTGTIYNAFDNGSATMTMTSDWTELVYHEYDHRPTTVYQLVSPASFYGN